MTKLIKFIYNFMSLFFLKKNIYKTLGALVSIFLVGFSIEKYESSLDETQTEDIKKIESIDAENLYAGGVQKVFNSRCIACHGCYESPCQLNLQSYEGLARGVHRGDVFDRERSDEVPPTKLYEDATTLEEWRRLGFKDVIGNKKQSVLLNALDLSQGRRPAPWSTYPEVRQCINQSTPKLQIRMQDKYLAMPHNLPALESDQIALIRNWVEAGAPPPPKESEVETHPERAKVIHLWEKFLNRRGYKYQLTSRYIYEHLFLAHLYIKDHPRLFYRMIRSKTPCQSPQMISTRTPNDDPGVDTFYYCILKFNATIVNKNHLPYEISVSKLNWIKDLFIVSNWEVISGSLPPYKKLIPKHKLNLQDLSKGILFPKENKKDIEQNKFASNPFQVFKNIPQESRYRFLLEDAYYHIMTFMKGTSCNGTLSVNAVQDHFFVLFMSPSADLKINTQGILDFHEFPGRYGNDVEDKKITSYVKQTETRKLARRRRNQNLVKEFPTGLPMEVIWNGDRTPGDKEQRDASNHGSSESEKILTPNNRNAILTIFRHNDSASIVRGPLGDLSKTAFVMDYSTFERMAYDLVINFDAFGSFGHMILTRTYMNLIRSDAEDNYLSFFPLRIRNKLLDIWYNDRESEVLWDKLREQKILDKLAQAILESAEWTKLHKKFLGDKEITAIPHNIPFSLGIKDPRDYHAVLMRKILFEHLGAEIIGPDDTLNWKKLKTVRASNPTEALLSELTQEVKDKKHPYVYFFPELSFIVLGETQTDGKKDYKKFYSMIHNREFNSISLMIGEEYHHTPEEDTLVLTPKVVGYYPNQFFYIENNELAIKKFVTSLSQITNQKKYQSFLKTYGIKRMDPEMWKIYDFIVDQYHKDDPIEAGYLDLSRYNY